MRPLKVALALIEQEDKYLLQLRPQRVGAGGLIGCFGGKVEEGEMPRYAVRREVDEETNLDVDVRMFEFLGRVAVTVNQTLVHAWVYRLQLAHAVEVEAKDGALVTMTTEEVLASKDKMTPGTRAVFEQFVEDQQG